MTMWVGEKPGRLKSLPSIDRVLFRLGHEGFDKLPEGFVRRAVAGGEVFLEQDSGTFLPVLHIADDAEADQLAVEAQHPALVAFVEEFALVDHVAGLVSVSSI